MEKKLQRIPHEGAVAGVCAGLGAYFNVDKTWVRIAFIFSVFFAGYAGIGLFGPIVYIVLWIVLPIKSFTLPQDPFNVDYRAPESQSNANHGFGSSFGTAPMDIPYGRPYVPKISKDRYVAGIILLVVGLFFLMHQLDVLYWRDFARFWPVLIIIIGLASIFGAFNRKRHPYPVDEKESEYTQEPDQPTDEGKDDEHTYTK